VKSSAKGNGDAKQKSASSKKDSPKPDAEKSKESGAKAGAPAPPQPAKSDMKVATPSKAAPPSKVAAPSADDSGVSSPQKRVSKDAVRQAVLERGVSGTVGWFSNMKGYGFIDRADKEERVFVHSTAIIHSNNSYYGLDEGEKVEFDIVQGIKGLEAAAVTGPGGEFTGFRLRAVPIGRRRNFVRNRFSRSYSNNRRNRQSKDDEGGSSDESSNAYTSASERSVEDNGGRRKGSQPKSSGDAKVTLAVVKKPTQAVAVMKKEVKTSNQAAKSKA
jgi:cold shock CspA family protein